MSFIPLCGRLRVPGHVARLILAGVALAVSSAVCAPFLPTGAVSAEAAQKKTPVDGQRLVGQWVRSDGGYVLELKKVNKDGSLHAAYFNPRRINVFRAELRNTKGTVTILVELRDINYPGSKYRLQYEAASDRLKGTYYQALENRTYDVEFVRMR
jgi:hypothetical protein